MSASTHTHIHTHTHTYTHIHIHTSELHLQQVVIVFRGGDGERRVKEKKFPGCPSLSYQSVICARRPPSSAAILRQHPGPQDAAGNTAGHQERCDNVTGYSRRRTLNTHVNTHTHIQYTQWIHIFMHTHTHTHTARGDTKTSTDTI